MHWIWKTNTHSGSLSLYIKRAGLVCMMSDCCLGMETTHIVFYLCINTLYVIFQGVDWHFDIMYLWFVTRLYFVSVFYDFKYIVSKTASIFSHLVNDILFKNYFKPAENNINYKNYQFEAHCEWALSSNLYWLIREHQVQLRIVKHIYACRVRK